MPSLYSSPQSSSTKAGTAQAVGQSIQNMPSFGSDFVQGMKWGYQGVTDTAAPFMAYRAAKLEKTLLGLQQDLIELQAQSLQTQADDAMRAGIQQSADVSYRIGQAKSSARTSMAAAGVRVGAAGSSAEILASFDIVKDAQRAVIMQNAIAQSFGYRKQAVDVQNQARAVASAKNQVSPWASAITSFINVGMSQMDFGAMGKSIGHAQSSGGSGSSGLDWQSWFQSGSTAGGFASLFSSIASKGGK